MPALTPNNVNGESWALSRQGQIEDQVLIGATASASFDGPVVGPSDVSIDITGVAITVDVLLTHSGIIRVSQQSGADTHIHDMNVVSMPLSVLSGVPVLRVRAVDVSTPTHLRIAVRLNVRSRRTEAISAITHEYVGVSLDAQTPVVHLDFPLLAGGSFG